MHVEAQQIYSGNLKYEIYTPQGGIQQSVKPGENYVVFRFGKPGKEKLGWCNFVYQDTLCYVKEGFYKFAPNLGIVVGSK